MLAETPDTLHCSAAAATTTAALQADDLPQSVTAAAAGPQHGGEHFDQMCKDVQAAA